MAKLSRRSFLGAMTLGSQLGRAGVLTTSQRSSERETNSQSDKPKNVLILMSDQHRPEAMGIAGDPVAQTPNLDALTRSAVRFNHAYCADPVCVPSRPSLLTGLYPHNLTKGHYSSLADDWPSSIKTIAHYFSHSGYMTGLIGKMHFLDGQTHGFDYHLDFNDWFQYLGPKARLYADETPEPDSGEGLPEIPEIWQGSGDPWAGVVVRDGREGLANVGHISSLPEEDHFESFVARESTRFLKDFGRRHPSS
jgi:choline-sulfatase